MVKPKVRRAVGTRTSLDVIRHLFKPPSPSELQSDRDLVEAGGVIRIIASETLHDRPLRPKWVRRGPLEVSNDRIVWKTRKHPDATFAVSEWRIAPNPSPTLGTLAILSLVNRTDSSKRLELRVPTPDLLLLHWLFNAR